MLGRRKIGVRSEILWQFAYVDSRIVEEDVDAPQAVPGLVDDPGHLIG